MCLRGKRGFLCLFSFCFKACFLYSYISHEKLLSLCLPNLDKIVRLSWYQVKSSKEGSLIELPCDANHFSPELVLDASFSNDSCVSSSLDDRSGTNICNL